MYCNLRRSIFVRGGNLSDGGVARADVGDVFRWACAPSPCGDADRLPRRADILPNGTQYG